MDNFGDIGHGNVSKSARKMRSHMHRRPLSEAESPLEYNDSISLSSTPSDRLSDAPSNSSGGNEASHWRKELNLNQCISRGSSTNLSDAEIVQKSSDQLVGCSNLDTSTEDHSATASLDAIVKKGDEIVAESCHSGKSGIVSDSFGNKNKVKKVKLKVGGITHMIHAKSGSESSALVGSSASKSSHSDATLYHEQENFGFSLAGKKSTLRGVPWKDFSKIGFGFKKAEPPGVDLPEDSQKQGPDNRQPYKNKPISKKYLADEIYDDEEDDDEIRYLQKLRNLRFASSPNAEYEGETRGRKLRKISNVMDRNTEEVYVMGVGEYEPSRSGKESKKRSSVRTSENTDYIQDDESGTDDEIEHLKKKQSKETIDGLGYPRKGSSITTRRKAIQAGSDTSLGLGASFIQFPDGLPPAPPRKKKEQLSEVEQQLRRAEAAQKRKIQSEKAAQESQEEAIRKILGQDSSRKKREEKIKKRQQELAEERCANNARVASNVVRWVMGPSGTVVIFPDEIGLPSIFEPRFCSYPPPREKCAGPSCPNVYKYRDSKSNLPLCSLRCYKAVHGKTQALAAC